ncbi:hypothetical protein DM02DRAFT_501953, partial [Periconia macrospinosa]
PKTTPCTRTLLSNAATAYLTSQTRGTFTPLTPYLSPNWTYTENNSPIASPLTSPTTILLKPLTIAYNRTIYDLDACATYTEIIAPSTQAPYVLGVQIRHSPLPPSSSPPTTNTTTTITSIDTITTTPKSWLFNATSTLLHAQQESWLPIPPAQQDSRDAIRAAGDAYLDMWSDASAVNRVPWGTPCTRLEGGAYTGTGSKNDSCRVGVPVGGGQKPNTGRRYVIDVEMGSVSVFCVWEHMMNAADSHEFRLEKGKLRYIHTMTSCGDKVCRL